MINFPTNAILVIMMSVMFSLLTLYLYIRLWASFSSDPRLSLYEIGDASSIERFLMYGVDGVPLPDNEFPIPPTMVDAKSPLGIMVTEMRRRENPGTAEVTGGMGGESAVVVDGPKSPNV
uniref:Cytochrome P450 n=1 Tax=Panagrellus redivivus TaxID=6233 RepID=A0A7E4W2Q2_PANRE